MESHKELSYYFKAISCSFSISTRATLQDIHSRITLPDKHHGVIDM